MRYWLMKSEPGAYSIDALKRDRKTTWNGVRNYQARNFMRDNMRPGDLVLFYHSNAEPPGVAGLAKVSKKAVPEPQDSTWVMVEIEFVEKFPNVVGLDMLRQEKSLAKMMVLQRGSRLSIQPVEPEHFRVIQKLGRAAKAR